MRNPSPYSLFIMTESLRRTVRGAVLICCMFSVFLGSVVPSLAALVREPYLQSPSPSSMTIVWRTNLTCSNDSRVQYGTTSGSLNLTATGAAVIPQSNSNVKDHTVTITGLNAGTTYFYNVGTVSGGGLSADCEGGATVDHYFNAAPVVGAPAAFSAWILGDSGDGGSDQIAVRNSMLTATASTPPNIILHAGDIAYDDGLDGEFTANHFNIYNNVGGGGILRHTPLWPTLGNHEAGSVNTSLQTGPYYEAHVLPTAAEIGGFASGTEAYYSFDYANVHFIVLDSMDSSRSPGSTMLTWLQNDLAGTGQEWVIVFFHHPPYTKGTHDSDANFDSGGRLTDMRETILPILEAGNVDLVMGGHSHIYERSYPLLGAYGYGTSPNFATPDFATLQASGNILDSGDGDPSGNGAYQNGTVYVVAGHGGRSIGANPAGPHPVMFFSEAQFGSVLMDMDSAGTTLTLRNLRADNGLFTDTFAINHPVGNQAPIVSAGSDQTTSVGATTTLNGTVSDDGDPVPPGTVTTTWTGSGPGTVTFADPSVVDTTVSFSLEGNYVLQLEANDSVLMGNDTVNITVQDTSNIPSMTTPVPSTPITTSSVTFDWTPGVGWGEYWLGVGTSQASVASSPYGDIFANSTGANTSQLVTGIPINGNPVYVRLWYRVAGSGNPWFFIDYTYPTGTGNQAPNGVIDLPAGPQTINAGDSVTFNGTGTDPDNNLPLTHLWTFGAGSGVANSTQEDPGPVQFNTAGTFTVTYTVTDAASPPLADPTPATVMITVGGGGSGIPSMTTPVPSTPITTSSVTFQWDPGVGWGEFYLGVGTSQASVANSPWGDIFSLNVGANTSQLVTGIPINGNPVYVRLWYRAGSGSTWFFVDYTYPTQQGTIENFTAYNDLAWEATQLSTRITTLTSPVGNSGLNSSGLLVDFATGLTTSVMLSITGGTYDGVANAAQGVNPTSGDALAIFDQIVTGQGVISYVDSAANNLVLTFSGMNPNKVYDVTFFSDRDRVVAPVDDWDRASLVTISDHDAFSNVSSFANDNPDETNGVLFTGPTDTSTRLPSDNNNGYVARFNAIDPGPDGDVVLTISFNGAAGEEFRGKYGSAVRLQESDGGGPANQAPNGVIDLPAGPQTINAGDSVTFNGTGTDPDNNLPLTHLWTFGAGSGVANSTQEDPGPVQFNTAGTFTVTYTVTDAASPPLADPTPATVMITVGGGGSGIPSMTTPVPSTPITTSSVTFQWDPGVGWGEFYLGVGTSQASVANSPWGDIFSLNVGANTSQLVTGIPINGNPVYVRLWYRAGSGSTWFFVDYTYPT